MRLRAHIKVLAGFFLGLSCLLHFPMQYWHHCCEAEEAHQEMHTGHVGFCDAEVEHCDLCELTVPPFSYMAELDAPFYQIFLLEQVFVLPTPALAPAFYAIPLRGPPLA